MIEGSGSVLVTNGSGCGSGRPRNLKYLLILPIRIPNTGNFMVLRIVLYGGVQEDSFEAWEW
jgi:hypothetical protein